MTAAVINNAGVAFRGKHDLTVHGAAVSSGDANRRILGTARGQLWDRVSETNEDRIAELRIEEFNTEHRGSGIHAYAIGGGHTIETIAVDYDGLPTEYLDHYDELRGETKRIHNAQDRYLEPDW